MSRSSLGLSAREQLARMDAITLEGWQPVHRPKIMLRRKDVNHEALLTMQIVSRFSAMLISDPCAAPSGMALEHLAQSQRNAVSRLRRGLDAQPCPLSDAFRQQWHRARPSG